MTPDEIKAFRETHKLSQSELALFLGVTSLTVSRWELGKRAVPSFLELALCEVARRVVKSKKRA